jgi:RNA-directed DNA polymerase
MLTKQEAVRRPIRVRKQIIAPSQWSDIKWRKVEKFVWKMQLGIFQAARNGEINRMRRLQKILIGSEAAKLKATRRVTQDNRGKKTAGIDGVKSLTGPQRVKLAKNLHLDGKTAPIRRVWIPKANGDLRPLGIPTIKDRAKQMLALLALDPEWEAKFEANSYGFRPGRSCHDAIEAIYIAINQKPKYVLDADIQKCFDEISHEKLVEKLNTFPVLERQIQAWLKAGIMEEKATEITYPGKGTPQGGVISPLLMNVALHGMEKAAKEFASTLPLKNQEGKALKQRTRKSITSIIRYADDFVVMHENLEAIRETKTFLEEWLKPVGLALKKEKTSIKHTLEYFEGKKPGFDFLGFRVRQYPIGKYQIRKSSRALTYRTLIRPTREKVKNHLASLRETFRKFKQTKLLIMALNPKIIGWARYYRTGVSYKIFQYCGALLFRMALGWARKKHKERNTKWIISRYFHTRGNKNWVFGSNKLEDKFLTLKAHTDVPIERHAKVRGDSSPYDGNLFYWAARLSKGPETSIEVRRLLKRQKGLCAYCGIAFFPTDIVEKDHIIPRKLGGENRIGNYQLLHGHCHDIKSTTDFIKSP